MNHTYLAYSSRRTEFMMLSTRPSSRSRFPCRWFWGPGVEIRVLYGPKCVQATVLPQNERISWTLDSKDDEGLCLIS